MEYLDNEIKAHLWFTETYDSDATLNGGYDATKSDIYSPKFGSWIEVKMIDKHSSARCGQFTDGTISKNPFSILLLNGQNIEENLINFVRYHYQEKQVEYFIVGSEDDFMLLSIEEFLSTAKFSLAKPYHKKSGTSSCPKKYWSDLIRNYNFIEQDGRIYCKDDSRFGEYFFHEGIKFFISKTNQGEVRKCSSTNNLTYHIEVKM